MLTWIPLVFSLATPPLGIVWLRLCPSRHIFRFLAFAFVLFLIVYLFYPGCIVFMCIFLRADPFKYVLSILGVSAFIDNNLSCLPGRYCDFSIHFIFLLWYCFAYMSVFLVPLIINIFFSPIFIVLCLHLCGIFIYWRISPFVPAYV